MLKKPTTSPIIIFFSLFLWIGDSFSQPVSGTLIDKTTEETIPFATIQIGKNYGVVSNQEGSFSINTAGFSGKDSLVISTMGYHRKSFALKDFQDGAIYLTQNLNQLDEVYVLDKSITVEGIMAKVNARIPENYGNSLSKFTVFEQSKNTTKAQDMDIEIGSADFIDKKTIEAFNKSVDSLNQASMNRVSNSYSTNLTELYFGKEDSTKAILKKATVLINKEKNTSSDFLQDHVFGLIIDKIKSANTFRARSGIIPIDDSLNLFKNIRKGDEMDTLNTNKQRNGLKRAFRKNGFKEGTDLDFVTETNRYKYKIEGVSKLGDEQVYHISFSPDGRRAKFEGNLYVSAETFAVLKATYQLAEGEHGEKVNLKFLLGIKYVESGKSGMVIYQKNGLGKYAPKYIRTTSNSYMYFNRSFTFTENNKNRDERIKLKFELKIETDNVSDNEYLIVDSTLIAENEYAAVIENEGVLRESTSAYDAEIWKDYDIIEPTQAIKEYEY